MGETAVAIGGDLRTVLGALAGVGFAGVSVLTLLPMMVPLDRPAAPPGAAAPAPAAEPADPAVLDSPAPGPRFDTVRVAPDGSGLVAGRADPGTTVAVMAGEEIAAEVTADADGRFVAFLELTPSAEPRALSLRDGAGGQSEETVIVAPTGAALGPAGDMEAEAAGPAAAPGEQVAAAAPTPVAPEAEGSGPAEPPEAAASEAAPVVEEMAPALGLAGEGAPGQAAVLLSDAEGVRVLQPPVPSGVEAEVLSSVALDAIAYDGEGGVVLSGRTAEGGGAVRLYLDNAPVAEAAVGADGQWSATLCGTESGDYTLRVDQLDAQGEVTSRIETPFRREARDALAAAMDEAQRPGQQIVMRTVQPGNTLWAIARDRYGEPMMYVQVFEMNRDRIRDPDLIYPGQVFVLPATEGR